MTGLLTAGDAAPFFHAAALDGNPRYAFDTAAGRPILLLLLGSARTADGTAALAVVARHRAMFDDSRAAFFGVTIDPGDAAAGRIAQHIPGVRWFLDYDGAISRRYQALVDGDYRPHWLLLDTTLRVAGCFAIEQGEAAIAALRTMIDTPDVYPAAPVLIVPRVLDPAICRRMIDLYENRGGTDSGFMREENGVTVTRVDHSHKRRADYHIDDEELREQLRLRLLRSLAPQIRRVFQWQATRIERWLISCYDGNDGGHFRAHRDNTTKGTAHRKFACTINLNAEDYDGGDLSFPEFGARTYRAPTGGAVIFSCSLLHEARAVTRGRRYAFLPFLYDEDGAALREANMAHVAPELAGYRSGIG